MAENITPSVTTSTTTPCTTSQIQSLWKKVSCPQTAAMFWIGYDFKVIPIGPGSKITTERWDQWLTDLDPNKVYNFWSTHPNHEVGFIVGDDVIVFDADTIEAVTRLYTIEARFGLEPKLIVLTSKGQHHYFKRAAGTIAKSDAHSTEQFPDRIDIKTGRALVVLPPSTKKTIVTITAQNKGELSEAPQAFIDAIYKHNGRTAPSEPKAAPAPTSKNTTVEIDAGQFKKLLLLLNNIDPDCGYEDWRNTLMAVFYETKGSDDGLALVDAWSCKGQKYKGTKDIETKWKSFRLDVERPVTIGTLIKMAKDAGANVAAIMNDDAFELCEGEVIDISAAAPEKATNTNEAATPIVEATPKTTGVKTPLSRYSMQDQVDELERQAMVQIPILGNIALLSQSTVIYAKPNTGKTLITLHLIIEAIKQGKIDPLKLFYINMDDDSSGLIVKARLAEEYGFQMIADGYQGFEAKAFRDAMEKMIETDTAKGVIVVLDTLKRFVDTMNKEKSRYFTKFTRKFSLKGGTVIALAHTNKNPDSNGKPVYSGTTDIVDDFDCAYTMSTILEQADTNQKVVEFSNIKRRGNVALTEAYSYAQESNISYYERLLSVQEVDPDQLESTKHEAETKTDAEVITVITACVINGITTKMELAAHAAERANISKRCAIKIIEKYTGNDFAVHLWSFDVRERGAKVFRILERPAEQPPTPAMATP